jgi:hypothetical protein
MWVLLLVVGLVGLVLWVAAAGYSPSRHHRKYNIACFFQQGEGGSAAGRGRGRRNRRSKFYDSKSLKLWIHILNKRILLKSMNKFKKVKINS